MRKDRAKAEALRKRGKSYRYIGAKLGIPKSTLAYWFQQPWSREIQKNLELKARERSRLRIIEINKARVAKWHEWHENSKKLAVKEYMNLKNNPLFIAGLMLYWGEGDKNPKNCRVRISNSDPLMIRLFYLFLKNILKVSVVKIKFSLLLYPDLPDYPQRVFWSSVTTIPLQQFNKSVYINGRHPTRRRLSHGVGAISVSSGELKDRMLKWIELCYQDLVTKALFRQI